MNIVSQSKTALVNTTHVRYFHVHKDSIMAQMGDEDTVEIYTSDNEEHVRDVFDLLIGEIKKKDDWIEMDELNRRVTGEQLAPGVIIG